MARSGKPPYNDSRHWGMPTIAVILLVILIAVCAVCCGAAKAIFPGGPF